MSARLAIALLLALPAYAVAPPPAQDTIWAGCAGGVTGGGTATRIVADGRMVRLTLDRAGAMWQPEQLGFDPERYARLARVLDDSGFARLRGGPPGNITCWLERVWANGRGWRVQWGGTDPPGAWPAGVRDVFNELRGLGR
jgi:hypothetical protein